jgi:hypothetical protein
MKEKKFDLELGEIFNTFEEQMLKYMEQPNAAECFSFKNGYIDLKYDVVKLFMQAVTQHQFLGSLDFDFETFKDKQRIESPFLNTSPQRIASRKQK